MFGEFIKQIRQRQRLGLREFCLQSGCDPSNWSKIEREVLPPPRDEDTLRSWAKQLGIKPGPEDWLKFFDYAAVDSGRIAPRPSRKRNTTQPPRRIESRHQKARCAHRRA